MFELPVEIVERILSFCDGKTLRTARSVNDTWKELVGHLTKSTHIWKRCCLQDIPRNELIKYTEKYIHTNDKDKWLNIYENWCAWQDIEGSIDFDIILLPVEIPRITCIAILGSYLAVGSEDGRVRIYNENWNCLHTSRFRAVRVKQITFMTDDEGIDSHSDKIYILIAYKGGTLVLTEFDGKLNEVTMIQDVKLFSVYKKYLCYEKRGGRITISKLCKNVESDNIFCEITFLRIYSPNEVSCMQIWGGIATFLINNEVKILKYNQNIAPISNAENKVRITFWLKQHPQLERLCHIYRNDIIICASTSDELTDQILELFILGDKDKYGKKLFKCWDAFQSYITCMFLYGNTFVLGVDAGNVYFYHVSSWKTFDIRGYQYKMIVGKHPIIGIDVKEDKDERIFYVSSSFNIHEITGYRTPFIHC